MNYTQNRNTAEWQDKTPEFTSLSIQFANLAKSTFLPSLSQAYTSTNTAVLSCPTQDVTFSMVLIPVNSFVLTIVEASTVIPPSPGGLYDQLCNCMHSSLGCVVAASMPRTTILKSLPAICSKNKTNCVGISVNGTTG